MGEGGGEERRSDEATKRRSGAVGEWGSGRQ
jgi:hypothetical protein